MTIPSRLPTPARWPRLIISFPSADFGTGTLTVTPFAASVAVVSTLPHSTYGQSVSFTVNVSGGGPTPTGTVQFLVDGTAFGTAVTLAGGRATSPSTTLLGAGNHTVEADYSGDSNYSASTGTYTQGVSKAHLTVTADPQSKAYGAAVPALTYRISGFVNGDTSRCSERHSRFEHVRSLLQPRGGIPDHRDGRHLVGGQLRLPQPGQRHLDGQQGAVDRDGRLEDQDLRGTVANPHGDAERVCQRGHLKCGQWCPALTTAATAASHVTGSSYPVFVNAGSLRAANYSFVFVNGSLESQSGSALHHG